LVIFVVISYNLVRTAIVRISFVFFLLDIYICMYLYFFEHLLNQSCCYFISQHRTSLIVYLSCKQSIVLLKTYRKMMSIVAVIAVAAFLYIIIYKPGSMMLHIYGFFLLIGEFIRSLPDYVRRFFTMIKWLVWWYKYIDYGFFLFQKIQFSWSNKSSTSNKSQRSTCSTTRSRFRKRCSCNRTRNLWWRARWRYYGW
jgi:hypothetical protein